MAGGEGYMNGSADGGGREVLIWGNLIVSRLCILKNTNRR